MNIFVKPRHISRAEFYFEDPTPEEKAKLLDSALKDAYEGAEDKAKIRNFSLEDITQHIIIQKKNLRNSKKSYKDELAEGLDIYVKVDFQIKELHLKNRILFEMEVRLRTAFFWIKRILMSLRFTLLYIIGIKS